MNFGKIAKNVASEELSRKPSSGPGKPKVESIDRRRQAREREMAIKSILNKASAITW